MKTFTLGIAVFVLSGCGAPQSQPAAPTKEPEPVAPASAVPAPPPEPTASAAPEAPPEATPPAKVEAAEPPPGSPRAKLMRAHFKEAELVRSALIAGNVAATTGPADVLTKLEGLGKAEQKSAQVKAMQAAAKRIRQSPDVPGAAAAFADLGVACGKCHRKGAGPKPETGEPPAADSSLKSRMRQHAWASERLWEGLYVPSDAAWNAGADLMGKNASFPEEVLKKSGVHARSNAEQLKQLVATAKDKKAPEDRATLYASLLATCAACHAVTK